MAMEFCKKNFGIYFICDCFADVYKQELINGTSLSSIYSCCCKPTQANLAVPNQVNISYPQQFGAESMYYERNEAKYEIFQLMGLFQDDGKVLRNLFT